jgi:hypothetical protein
VRARADGDQQQADGAEAGGSGLLNEVDLVHAANRQIGDGDFS